MSKGLRNFNNFLTNEFALGKTHVNLYKNDNDVYIHIPILESNDISPFGCGLIYNNDGTTLSPSLGKGFVPSFLFYISKSNDTFTIKFADRFEITYTKDESDGCYVNTFDNSFIRVKDSKTRLYIQGGYYIFDIDGNNNITGNWYYPLAFIDSYDNEMTFVKTTNDITINTIKNVNVVFNIMNNEVVDIVIKSKDNGSIINQYLLTHDSNNQLYLLTLKHNNNTIESLSLSYESSRIKSLVTSIENKTITYTYDSSNKVINVVDSKDKSNIDIVYGNNDVRVTNERDETHTYYFDSNGNLSIFKDHHDVFSLSSFSSTKKLLTRSRSFYLDYKENLLVNGNFLNGISPWQTTNNYAYTVTDESENYLSFPNKSLLLVQDINSFEGIYQDINISGYAFDRFTLFLFTKLTNLSTSTKGVLEVYYNSELKESIEVSISANILNLTPRAYEFKVNYAYTKLRLCILNKRTKLLSMLSGIRISDIRFIKGGLIEEHTYDEDGYLIKSTKGGKDINYSYYPRTSDRVSSIASVDTNTFSTTIDDTDERGNFLEVSYNVDKHIHISKDERGNVLSNKTFSNNEVLCTYNSYTNTGLLISKEDVNGRVSNYSYSSLLKISEVTFNDELTNAYTYSNKGLLEKITFKASNTSLIENNISYSSSYKISQIYTSLNAYTYRRYNYTYNNNELLSEVGFAPSFDINIRSMDYGLESYEYESISTSFPRYVYKKKYGSNTYSFIYGDNGEKLNSIMYNNALKYSFLYDDFDRLIGVNNNELSINKTYTYNDLSSLNEVDDRESVINYYYDNENNNYAYKEKLTNTINHTYINTNNYDSLSNKSELIHALERIESVYVASFARRIFNDDTISVNPFLYNFTNKKIKVVETERYDYDYIEENGFTYLSLKGGSNNKVTYEGLGNYYEGISFGMIFRPLTTNEMTFARLYGQFINIIVGKTIEQQLYIKFNDTIYTSDLILNSNKDNVVSFDISFVNNTIAVKVNGEVELINFTSSPTSALIVSLELFDNISTTDSLTGYITCLYFSSTDTHIDSDSIQRIEEVLRCALNVTDYKNNASKTFIPYVSSLTSYDIYPLDGSFNSLTGKGLFYRSTDNNIPSFVYDDLMKQNVYMPTLNNKIIIDKEINGDFTLCLQFRPFSTSDVTTLFEIGESQTYIKIKLVNGVLKLIDSTGTSYVLSESIPTTSFSSLAMSTRIMNSVNSETKRVTIYYVINGVYSSVTFNSNSLATSSLCLGNAIDGNNRFNGLISTLAIKNSTISSGVNQNFQTNLNTLINNINKNIKTVDYLDNLNRVNNRKIVLNGTTMINKTYSYRNVGQYSNNITRTSNEVSSLATSIIGSSSKNDNLTYNNLGLISTHNTYGYTSNIMHTYTYDNFLRLTSVKNYNSNINYYEYDINNNITKIVNGSTTLELVYDSYNRLLSCGNDTYEYNSTDPFLITKINKSSGSINLSYMGRRLISYTDSNNTITFNYDEMSRRIRKTINGISKDYYYHDDRLIATKKGSDYVYYIYDNNNQVIGFIYNSNYYFYIRDITGTIKEIIDNTGIVRYTYTYTPYGKIISQSASSSEYDWIGSVNDIAYKGYVYDEETELYWVSSRYYSPELCRWISPDSIEYLDPESINGLNLYAYCGNDPVMYYDPSGHSVILVIGLLVGSFIVGAGASAVSQGLTYGWDEINYWQAAVDGLFALGSTALAMTGIGALASAGIGAVAGWSQYAIGSAFHGEDLTLLGSITAAGLGFIGGAISGAGARNSAKIASSMKLTGKGASAVKAITTASNRYLAGEISMKGLQATTRLWGNVALNAVQDAITPTIRRLMVNGAITIAGVTIGTAAVNYSLSYVY